MNNTLKKPRAKEAYQVIMILSDSLRIGFKAKGFPFLETILLSFRRCLKSIS